MTAPPLSDTLEAAGWKWDPNLQAWYRVAYTEGADHAEMECLRTPGMHVRIPIDELANPALGNDIKHTFDAMFIPEGAKHVDAHGRYLETVIGEIRGAIRTGTPVVVTGQPRTLHLS